MPPRKPKKIFSATRIERRKSSNAPVKRISGKDTTTRRINHDIQLFPPRKPKSNPPNPAKNTRQKKPESRGQFTGYDKKGTQKKFDLKKNKLDLKG